MIFYLISRLQKQVFFITFYFQPFKVVFFLKSEEKFMDIFPCFHVKNGNIGRFFGVALTKFGNIVL